MTLSYYKMPLENLWLHSLPQRSRPAPRSFDVRLRKWQHGILRHGGGLLIGKTQLEKPLGGLDLQLLAAYVGWSIVMVVSCGFIMVNNRG